MAYTLLTGATGLLGRYLMRDLYVRDIPLAVVARPSGRQSARARIEGVLSRWERQLGHALPRPVVLTGDLTEVNLGLSQDDLNWVKSHCESVIHNAASLKFTGKDRAGEPWRSNLTGTRNLLELCRTAGIGKVHYVSTAYVCGQRAGIIREAELDCSQIPGNDYEASKIAAEKLARESAWIEQLTIYRPAIIAGDSRTAYTNTFHGFYFPLKVAAAWSKLLNSEEGLDFSTLFNLLGLSGDESKNFVPVDWVSAVISRIIADPTLHRTTYHLASDEPVRLATMTRIILESITGNTKPKTNSREAEAMLNSDLFKHQFRAQMEAYQSYWRADPSFCTQNTRNAASELPCPPVDEVMMKRWCRFAIENKFKPPADIAVGSASNVEDSFCASVEPNSKTGNVGIQINGAGGGQFQVPWHGAEVATIGRGISDHCQMKIYLNSETWHNLASRRTTPAQALATGSVHVEGLIRNPELVLEGLICN